MSVTTVANSVVRGRASLHALRLGLARGVAGFLHEMTTRDGIAGAVIWNGLPLVILILYRNATVPGTSLSLATVAMPGILGLAVVAVAMSVAFYVALEREDGTLVRVKTLPGGMTGYVSGVIVGCALETVLGVAIILIPSLVLFDGLTVAGIGRWVTFAWVAVLGLLASVPLGFVIGSLVSRPRTIGGVGMFAIGGLAWISGIFVPLQQFPGWVQTLAQVLPVYWVGVGMRSVFLPDAAMTWELTGSWRLGEAAAVLSVWAVVCLTLASVLLRRVARRESGATVESRREEVLKRTV